MYISRILSHTALLTGLLVTSTALKAMEDESSSQDILRAMATAKEFHEQQHQDQDFGYVKFDLQLEEDTTISPWIVLPTAWIPAFNSHLHTYYPDIKSSIYMQSEQSSESMELPAQFFNAPAIISFTSGLDLFSQLKDLSEKTTTTEQVVPVVVIEQNESDQFITWLEIYHPDLLHPKTNSSNDETQHLVSMESQTEQHKVASNTVLWKILSGTRKGARIGTKIGLGTVSGAAGGVVGLVAGTLGASAGGILYSIDGQMKGGYFGGTQSKSPILDFFKGVAASPFVGAGIGGYMAVKGTNKLVDYVDSGLCGKPETSSNH